MPAQQLQAHKPQKLQHRGLAPCLLCSSHATLFVVVIVVVVAVVVVVVIVVVVSVVVVAVVEGIKFKEHSEQHTQRIISSMRHNDEQQH
jgi:Flp pilus assembly protein TadB